MNSKTGKRFWRVKRHTCPVRFRKKLAGIKDHIRKHRHEKTLLLQVKRVVQGWLNYYAVKDNGRRVSGFTCEVKRMLFKWLNRRSQKLSFDWDEFSRILRKVKFPEGHILKDPFFGTRPIGVPVRKPYA